MPFTSCPIRRPHSRKIAGAITLLLFITTSTIIFSRKPSCNIAMPVDDYYPKIDFKLVSPAIKPVLRSKKLFLVVVVNSGANGEKYFQQRQAIRQTWARQDREVSTLEDSKWEVFFVLGKTYNEQDRKNLQEADKHNDMLIGDFKDIYLNLIIKTMMSHLWASSLDCCYILKADDDVYIRVPRVIAWLKARRSHSRFYGGDIYTNSEISRDPCSPWGISKKYYPYFEWPPFCYGLFHVLSADVVPEILNHTRTRIPFHTDDAYVGVAADDLNINAVQIPGFEKKELFAEFWNDLDIRQKKAGKVKNMKAIGHKLTPEYIYRYHEYFKTTESS